jgi:FkbM family methyltransferase
VIARLRNRARRTSQRLILERLRGPSDGELFVDYGWGGLIYSGDGDAQELIYHLHQREWHREIFGVLAPLVGPGDTVVDVGANLGFVSLMLAPRLRPAGTVIALEPSPRTYRKLRATVEKNAIGDVVRTMNVGAGASAGDATLHQVSASSGNATILGGSGPGEAVSLIRLDDLGLGASFRLLKIDTEGFESEVLKGGAEAIAAYRPQIFIELGGHFLDGTLAAVEVLTELGYETEALRRTDWEAVGNGANFLVAPRAAA